MAHDVVCNAGPLIHLAMIGRFGVLQRMFSDAIHLPPAVYREVVIQGQGQAGAPEVAKALKDGWMRLTDVENRTAVTILLDEIHAGEAEAIILATQLGCKVLLDDGSARDKATRLGLTVSGTIGVLLLAQHSGIIKDLKPDLDKLVESGFHLGRELYQQLCSRA